MEAGNDVVCITLTGTHSVTYNSAWTAAQAFPGRVEVVDGRSISLGYGIQVLEAARLAAAGVSREAVVAALLDLQKRIMIRFFLETLEQVKRGGRLDALMPVLGRLGQALNIRAVLTVNDEGRISLVGPARGRHAARSSAWFKTPSPPRRSNRWSLRTHAASKKPLQLRTSWRKRCRSRAIKS